jgi:hypothetical protein
MPLKTAKEFGDSDRQARRKSELNSYTALNCSHYDFGSVSEASPTLSSLDTQVCSP